MKHEEIWKDSKYENYEVSNLGNVRHKRIGKNIRHQNDHGYSSVSISCGSRSNVLRRKVHRLVAETFIPNPENKKEVNHINGNKKDNRVENLEWVTAQENTRHAIENGFMNYSKPTKKIGGSVGNTCLNKGIIAQDLNDGRIYYFHNKRNLARVLDIPFMTVSGKMKRNDKIGDYKAYTLKDFDYDYLEMDINDYNY